MKAAAEQHETQRCNLSQASRLPRKLTLLFGTVQSLAFRAQPEQQAGSCLPLPTSSLELQSRVRVVGRDGDAGPQAVTVLQDLAKSFQDYKGPEAGRFSPS